MQTNNNSTETPTPSGISRRTVVKGAAWAVPAIAVAGAVPAMAASVLPCLAFTLGGASCKWPGSGESWSYDISVEICNTCPTPITVRITQITSNSGAILTPCEAGYLGTDIVVPGNQCVTTPAQAFTSTNSANFISFWGSVNGGAVMQLTPQTGNDAIPSPTQDCTSTNPCVGATTTTTTAAAATTTTTTTAEVTTTTTTAAEVTTTTTTAA